MTQNLVPSHAMSLQSRDAGKVRAVQVMPSAEVIARLFVPFEIAQKTLPFHITLDHVLEVGMVRAVQLIPSVEE